MDIQSVNLDFVQQFLRLNNEQSITKMMELLSQEKVKQYESALKPMSQIELKNMMDDAETDVATGKMTTASSLREDIDNWT